jgi:hypothetical protein
MISNIVNFKTTRLFWLVNGFLFAQCCLLLDGFAHETHRRSLFAAYAYAAAVFFNVAATSALRVVMRGVRGPSFDAGALVLNHASECVLGMLRRA